MKYVIVTVLLILGSANPIQAQVSIGGTLDFFMVDASRDKPFNKYINLGVILKKNLKPSLNLVSGATIRFFDAPARGLVANTDHITFSHDVHQQEMYYIPEGETLRFSYINIPVGLEYKLTTWLRASYAVENNLLMRASGEVDQHFQYGKKSLNKYMMSHNVQLLIHPRAALGIGLGVVFNPGIIRKDLTYTYQFMSQVQDRLSNSYIINLSLWADAPFIKRKRAL
jgi:hypothetical protein